MAIPMDKRYIDKTTADLYELHNQNPGDEYVLLAYVRSLCNDNKINHKKRITKFEDDFLKELYKSSDIDIKLEVARIYRNNYLKECAISVYESLFNTENNYIAFYEVGCIYKEERDLENAKYYFQRAMNECPEKACRSQIAFAKTLTQEGNNAEAINVLKELLTRERNNSAVLELAKIYASMKNFDDAYSLFMTLFTYSDKEQYSGYKCGIPIRNSDYFYTLAEIGNMFTNMGDGENAKRCFDELIEHGGQKDKNIAKVKKAKFLFSVGKDIEAVSLLKSLLNTPSAGFAKKELAVYYTGLSKFDIAEEYYRELIRSGNPKDRYYGYSGLAELYLIQKKFDLARACYDDSKKNTNMDEDDRQLGYARVDFKEKKYDSAIKILEKIIKTNSRKKMLAFSLLGKIYMELNDYEKARKYLNQNIQLGFESFDVILDLIHIDTYERKYDDAFEKLNFLVKKYPKYKKVFKREFGVLYVKTGDYCKAEKELKESLGGYRYDDLFSHLDLGRLYSVLGRFEEAKDEFQYLIGSSFEIYALVDLGLISLTNKDFDQAIKYFDRVINKFPKECGTAVVEKAKIFIINRRYDVAEKMLLSVIDGDSEHSALLELGRLYVLQERYSEATEMFNKIINNNMKNKYFAVIELGKIAYILGDNVAAEEYFMSYDENHIKSVSYSFMELANLYVTQGKFKEAREYYKKLKNGNFKEQIQYLSGVAQIAILEGNFFEAENLYSILLSNYGAAGIFGYLARGKLYVSQGRYDESISDFKMLEGTVHEKDALFELAKLDPNGMGQHFIDSTLSTDSPNWDCVYYSGILSVQLKDFDVAESCFNKLYNCETLSSKYRKLILHSLGLMYVEMNDYEKAKDYFNKLIDCDLDTKADAYLELGKIYLLESNFDEAIKYFEFLLNTKNKNVALDYLLHINSILGNDTQYYSGDIKDNGNYVTEFNSSSITDVSCDKVLTLK